MRQVAPGIWRLSLGTPERETPVGMRDRPIAGLAALPAAPRPPLVEGDLAHRRTRRGYVVELPIRDAPELEAVVRSGPAVRAGGEPNPAGGPGRVRGCRHRVPAHRDGAGERCEDFVLHEDDGETCDFERGAATRFVLSWDGGRGAARRDGDWPGRRYEVKRWKEAGER